MLLTKVRKVGVWLLCRLLCAWNGPVKVVLPGDRAICPAKDLHVMADPVFRTSKTRMYHPHHLLLGLKSDDIDQGIESF